MFLKREKPVIYLEIAGTIPRVKGIQDIISKRPSFLDIIETIVRKGKRSAGIFAEISTTNLTLSEAWELKRAIEIVRKYGVKTVAYIREAGIPELFLSESFNKVYTSERSYFNLIGFSSTLNTFGDFFKKIKVKIESVKSGKLKSIPDLLSKSEVPDEIKRDVKRIIDGIYETLCKEVKRFPGNVFISGILSSKELLLSGAVDGITNESISNIIKKEFGTSEIEFVRKPIQIVKFKRGKTVAILDMIGTISENPSPNFISLSRYSEVINRLTENDNIQAVIVRVNSRGGDATVSEMILEKLKNMSLNKELTISISSIAASGGYLISLASNEIFATPFSLIGSIGVFLIKPYIGELLSSIGIKSEIVGKGELSSIFSAYKELSPKEKSVLQNLVREEHEKFIKVVAETRKIPEEKVRKIADGSVFTGKDSKELKLINDTRSIADIFDHINEQYAIEEYPKLTIFDIMKVGTFQSLFDADTEFLLNLLREKYTLLSYLPLNLTNLCP